MDIAQLKKFEDLRLYIAQSFWSFWFGFSFETLKSILWHVWNLKLFDKFLFVFLVRTLLYNVPCKLLVSIIAIVRISLQREKVPAHLIETVSKKFVLYDKIWSTSALDSWEDLSFVQRLRWWKIETFSRSSTEAPL